MKFPYGICDFRKITTKYYFYCDRTAHRIPLIEKGEYVLFLRPRRFGGLVLNSATRIPGLRYMLQLKIPGSDGIQLFYRHPGYMPLSPE